MPKRKLEGKIIYQSIPDTDNVKRKYNDIHRDLLNIRKDNINTESLVRILEYEKYLEDVLDEQRLDFCKLYTKKLLEKYLKSLFEKDIYFKCALDFLCAIYGFKKDFESQKNPLYKRYKKYWGNEKDNLLFYNIKKESNVDSEFGKIDREIIDELAKIITLSVFETGDGEKLNFLNDENFSLIKREVQASQRDSKDSSLQKQRGDTTKLPQDPNLQELNINKPDLSAPVKVDIESDKPESPVPPEPEDEIAKYIAKTQTASYHDEFSHEIYAALCHEGESPYSEWVATWLLKCIRETFGDSLDAEIMLASFALMVNYDLGGSDKYERRLFQYLRESEYYETRCKKPFRKINFNNLRPSEEEQLMEDLKQDEQELVSELVTKIDNITAPNKYVEDLAGYGKYVPKNNSYQPKIPKMLYRKKRKKKLQTFTILTVLLFSISTIKVVFILQEKNNITTISDEYPSSKYVRGIDVGFNE